MANLNDDDRDQMIAALFHELMQLRQQYMALVKLTGMLPVSLHSKNEAFINMCQKIYTEAGGEVFRNPENR